MTIAISDRPTAFRIGRVFGDTFSVLRRNLVLSIGLAIVFSGIPSFLYQLWVEEQAGSAADFSVIFLIYMIPETILEAALVRVAIDDLNGQQPTFPAALGRGIAALLPIIGLVMLTHLGMLVGFVLLLVPGIYLFVRWSAAIPVLVHERIGIGASLKRSSELTAGSRLRIFLLLIILIIAILGVQIVLETFLLPILAAVGTSLGAASLAVVSAVSSLIWSIAMAVTYVELRYVKEGADVKELAEIFA